MPKLRAAKEFVAGEYEARTIWTMTRHGLKARCALRALPGCWEIGVSVDARPLLFKRGTAVDDLLAMAGQWRGRMADIGWTLARPGCATVDRWTPR